MLLIMLSITRLLRIECAEQQNQGITETNSWLLSNNTAIHEKLEIKNSSNH